MSLRSIPVAAPFRWFMKALDVGRKNPKALFGGFALLMVVALVPSVLQMGIELLVKPGVPVMMAVYAVSTLLSLVLMPPVAGGALRLLDACENGRPATAGNVFDGFRDQSFAVRMILTALLITAVYVVVLLLLYLVMPGKEFMFEIFSRSAGLAPGQQPDLTGMPPFSPMFLLWFPGAMLVLVMMSHAYLLAFGEAALGGKGPVAAVTNGFFAVFRNSLPFLVFSVVACLVGVVLVMVIAVVLGLGIGLLTMISPALALAVAIPVYLAMMLVMYVVMFGFYYHGWREIFGVAVAPPPLDTVAA